MGSDTQRQQGSTLAFHRLFSFVLLIASAVFFSIASQASARAEEAAPPFGSNLFQGHFTGNAASVLQSGDRIVVRLWGEKTLDDTLMIDTTGHISLGELGSVPVAGLPLDPKDHLEQAIRSKLSASGLNNIQVYAHPLDTVPVSVFVTGYVPRPGKYTGSASDTILAFLDKAGGIDRRGSYRAIKVMRNGSEVSSIDLYPFVLQGDMPRVRFQNGDTIVVQEKGATVAASGEVRNPMRFEFRSPITGSDLVALADPKPRVSHVSLTGSRRGVPYSQYLPLIDFRKLTLQNDDQVRFLADAPGDTITVTVQGAIRGASVFPVRRNTRLSELRNYISLDPERSDLAGLYIKRKSVAERQKKAIEDALRRLEQNAHTATSSSSEEAQIRAKEAEMISSFIARAREVQTEGVVVVANQGTIADLAMEDGDVIVIPEKTDVVLISGEVMMPQAIVWSEDKAMKDYIRGAGGFSSRAEESSLLVMRPSGELFPKASSVQPGDQILVLPRVESKSMQTVKDVAQILYQIAVACKVILDI